MSERSHTIRRGFLLGSWMVAGAILLARSVQVQVLHGDTWAEVAERQHRRSLAVPAPRGRILDRDGTALVESHERLRIAVAPRELSDAEGAARALVEAIELAPDAARRIVTSSDPWIVLPGSHPPAVRDRLRGIRGIHIERQLERFLPHGDLALGVLGRVRDGTGVGGVEQSFESILAGMPGQEIQARDNEGRPIPGESYMLSSPVPGGDVELTLDLELQEIGREALAGAMEETGARGGDLLITDPHTGEILAMVSLRKGASGLLSAVNAPYEPGSTLKPFTVAGLLTRNLVSLGDTVDAENGQWAVAGRTLNDVGRPQGAITVARALQTSSNVGVAKAAQVFAPAQQYENLRDFGFGVPTGLGLPGEASGTLRRPEDWSRQSPASLAIGYEIAVTPIQMAMAYGALANGGWLMEPRIVREVRAPDGRVLERMDSRRIRRVAPESVARQISGVMVDVVEDGTGTAARMASFKVAGKSGTSRAYSVDSGYDQGGYFSSFVGFFPADDPQLVVFVKLERPQGSYYGGSTAAPVTRATLEAILATRQAPLDRRSLVSLARRALPESGIVARFAGTPADGAPRGAPPRPASIEPSPEGRADDEPVFASRVEGREDVPVPDVSGLPLRTAVRRIHSLGLRIRWSDEGPYTSIRPAPGTRLLPGDTVVFGGRP